MSKIRATVALLIAVGSIAFASTDGWRLFSSSTGFSVSYPGTWVRNGISTDRLQIRSSKGGAEGIGIKRDQAEITVVEVPDLPKQTLAQVIAYYTQGTKVISERDSPRGAGPRSCDSVKEILSREAAIPPEDSPISVPAIINTDYFCELDRHKVVILLRNWNGDKSQREYQQIALRMAESVHLEATENVR